MNVLYSAIRPAIGQTTADVIRQAQRMGYTMTRFNGWDDGDLGMRHGDMKGPRRDEAEANAKILYEIQDACEVVVEGSSDFPHILYTVVTEADVAKGYIRA